MKKKMTINKLNKEQARRLKQAAWSATRFVEIFTQFNENKDNECLRSAAIKLLKREALILLKRMFSLWIAFQGENSGDDNTT